MLILIAFTDIKAQDDPYHLTLGNRVLRKGDEGVDVAILQRKLKEIGLYEGRIDGIFGKMTREAVVQLQKNNGLKADGVCGEKTLALLPPDNMLSRMDVSREDIIQLAYLINGEARG
ncbi:MAG: cell wall hydrolase, partial [Halanaerobiaceae bacterium]|nr:cell wall hydrolase [Halanaerobiaceae bacterium]